MSAAVGDPTARTAIPVPVVRGLCEALLCHRWDLPYIIVQCGGPGRTTLSGPYADEVAALLALDEISSGAGVTQVSMAQLHPALRRTGEE